MNSKLNIIKQILIFILLLLPFVGCQKKIETPPEVLKSNATPTDFALPQLVFNEIKKSIGENVKIPPEYLMTDLSVRLTDDGDRVLVRPDTIITFGPGGGDLDLKEHLQGEGSFYLSFPAEQFLTKPALEAVYFVSQNPQVEVDGETYGLGCGKVAKLTPQLEKLQKPKFLKLNTFDQRYLAVSGGQYIFVFKGGMQYFLTHVTVFDSRSKTKSCVELVPKTEKKKVEAHTGHQEGSDKKQDSSSSH